MFAEWAVCQAGMDHQWLRAFLRHCDYEDPTLERQLFGSPPTLWQVDWEAACRAANLRLWGEQRLAAAIALHQPRPALQQLVEVFLGADQAGLILVGASGLGKTSLALWLAGRMEVPRPVLVYPAARLAGTKPLADLLRDALGPPLSREGVDSPSPLTWPILVIFDGINESPEMMRVAWQLDRGVSEADGLKVMLTVRPESFQLVRHRVALAEHCYFTGSTGIPPEAVAVDPPAVQILLFTLDELPAAYDRYRRTYALETPYAGLSASMRQALRHPLTLSLLAQTYAGHALPNEVDNGEIVQRLLEALVAAGRLYPEDIRFIEDEVMPLMLAPGHWANVVTAEQMATRYTAAGRRLFTPGEPGPLTRLMDAGVLAVTGGALDEPLRFAHERFYEHFAWRRLCRLRAASDVEAFFAGLLTAPAFLHVPRRRLLAEEIGRRPLSWLADLVQRGPASSAGVVVGALEEWGRLHPGEARGALRQLWLLGRPRMARWLNALGLSAPDPPASARSLQRLAVSVAGALGDEDLLLHALLTGSRSLQRVVIDEILQSIPDPAVGWRLLDQVGRRVTGRWDLPHLAATWAFFQLVTSIRFQRDHATENPTALRDQVRAVVRRLAHPAWRGILVWGVVEGLVRPAERALVSGGLGRSFDSAFRLPAEQRRHLEALAPFIDWATPGFGSAYEHIRGVLDIGAVIARWFVTFAIVPRGLRGEPEAREMIVTLLQEAIETDPLPSWSDVVFGAVADIIRQRPERDPDVWAGLDAGVGRLLATYPSWHDQYRTNQITPPHRLLGPAYGVGQYVMAREAAGLLIQEGPVWKVIVDKVAGGDVGFTVDYLREVQFLAWDRGRVRLALRLIRPVLACGETPVQQALAELLARVRALAPEDVREMLESGAAPAEVRSLIHSWPVEESSGERWYFNAWDLIYRLLLESETARQAAVRVFGHMPHFADARSWLRWSAKVILNALAEEELFAVEDPG